MQCKKLAKCCCIHMTASAMMLYNLWKVSHHGLSSVAHTCLELCLWRRSGGTLPIPMCQGQQAVDKLDKWKSYHDIFFSRNALIVHYGQFSWVISRCRTFFEPTGIRRRTRFWQHTGRQFKTILIATESKSFQIHLVGWNHGKDYSHSLQTSCFIWYAKYSASVDISTTPTTSNLVPKRFWSQMAWQYLAVPYHGYHKGCEAYLLWKSSLKDHASNAAESVDTNLRGLNFSGSLFRANLGCKRYKTHQNTMPFVESFGDPEFWPVKEAAWDNISSFGFGRLLSFAERQKARHVRGRWLKAETRVFQIFPKIYTEIVHKQSINNSMRNADNHGGRLYAL